jgi:hypothetical protein
MVSQKSLSHSSRMRYAAPPLLLLFLPSDSRFLVPELLGSEMSASSLADVRAARGGLDGGEGIPEIPRTSGKPQCPAGPGSGVVEARETSRGVDAVGRGENAGGAAYALAIAITTIMIVVFAGSHCCRFLPRLRWWRV